MSLSLKKTEFPGTLNIKKLTKEQNANLTYTIPHLPVFTPGVSVQLKSHERHGRDNEKVEGEAEERDEERVTEVYCGREHKEFVEHRELEKYYPTQHDPFQGPPDPFPCPSKGRRGRRVGG